MWRGKQHLWGELAVWLVLGGGAYALSFQFAEPVSGYRFGATGWPRAIIVLLLAVALAQFALRMAHALRDPVAEPSPRFWSQFFQAGARANVTVALAFALPVLYVAALRFTGFYLTTPLFLAAYLYLLGERRWSYVIGVALAIYALMVLVFTTLLYVPLPVGNWPLFYDVNNWLLEAYR
ncbi:MAG TPA: tripartite tricarboxylate transporter TctB family protein [Burkholderiales bacterium]